MELHDVKRLIRNVPMQEAESEYYPTIDFDEEQLPEIAKMDMQPDEDYVLEVHVNVKEVTKRKEGKEGDEGLARATFEIKKVGIVEQSEMSAEDVKKRIDKE